MGILNNTVSICQFQVIGTPPAGDLPEWVGKQLAEFGFRSIEQTGEELSIGWVQLDDPQESSFSGAQTFQHDHYLAFSLRRDQRKLPATLFKAYKEKAEEEFLAANPGMNRIPKQKREDLRDAVRGALFAKTLPVPAVYDVIWDTRSNLLTFTSLGSKTVDLFTDQFKKTFGDLRLVAIHPFARASQVVDESLKPTLEQANRAATEAVLEMIEANQWLGRDFLLWLMHETMNTSAEFAVNQPGPAVEGEGFVAYLNDRLQLLASNDSGVQKVTVSGPQDQFSEVRTALQDGKEILEAVLYLEKQEQTWKLTLKGDVFHFASFKAPPVTIEKDDLTDPAMEREAVFFERMYLMEEGLQLFNSLYARFLKERLAGSWPSKEQAIRDWLA